MKTINKNMTNAEIYSYAVNLLNALKDCELMMPAAINFSIAKNKQTLSMLAEDIEKYRIGILNKYGAKAANGNTVAIPEESVEDANKELQDLLLISQDVRIYTFTIEELNNISLTTAQMEAILFMIDEE